MERDSRKRAEALLAQMTATEKVGQLNQHLYGFRIYHVEDGKIIFTQELKDEVKKWGGIGTIYGLYRAEPWAEKNYETGLAGGRSMQANNQLQNYVRQAVKADGRGFCTGFGTGYFKRPKMGAQ